LRPPNTHVLGGLPHLNHPPQHRPPVAPHPGTGHRPPGNQGTPTTHPAAVGTRPRTAVEHAGSRGRTRQRTGGRKGRCSRRGPGASTCPERLRPAGSPTSANSATSAPTGNQSAIASIVAGRVAAPSHRLRLLHGAGSEKHAAADTRRVDATPQFAPRPGLSSPLGRAIRSSHRDGSES
jgi:hypothetical protein